MQTGENIQGLRKIIDFTRLLSLIVLGIHVYISCYGAFKQWQLTAGITDHRYSRIWQILLRDPACY